MREGEAEQVTEAQSDLPDVDRTPLLPKRHQQHARGEEEEGRKPRPLQDGAVYCGESEGKVGGRPVNCLFAGGAWDVQFHCRRNKISAKAHARHAGGLLPALGKTMVLCDGSVESCAPNVSAARRLPPSISSCPSHALTPIRLHRNTVQAPG